MSYTPMFKQMRKLSGMTQEELAEKAGIPVSTYRTWEQGVAKKIPLEAACRIADILNCTPNDLCGWYINHPEANPAAVPPGLAPDEARVVESYRELTPERRRMMKEQMEDAARRSREQEPGGALYNKVVNE